MTSKAVATNAAGSQGANNNNKNNTAAAAAPAAAVIQGPKIHRNLPRWELTKHGVDHDMDTVISERGALTVRSYLKTGRSPGDKRIVMLPEVEKDVDWGKVNMPLTPESFALCRARAVEFLNRQEELFQVDAFVGHDPRYRLKVRVYCTRAYHAMFMLNMLIEPTAEELAHFGEPDYTIYNAGRCPADRTVPGVDTECVVALNFRTREQVILGTEYAGEMKKGMLTVMMYAMTKRGLLCMHASANEGREKGDVTVFFGLSGTGKTTLSADPHRYLIGDDEHVWTDTGVFNVEGGCYAKAIGLSPQTEPEIFNAIRFGAVAENVVLNPRTNEIDFNNTRITENTRVAYPLTFIPGAKLPAVAGHPKNIVFLTNDAYGVMPPVARLTPAQAKFWFISGYTAKVPGTETHVKTPSPTFSACFGGPFLVMHPTVYGELLARNMQKYNARVWLLNTGWSGGGFGTGGKRMKLALTRSIIDAIHDGELEKAEYETMPGWGLQIPRRCKDVPAAVLNPYLAWQDKAAFVQTIDKLAGMFRENFDKYKSHATPDVLNAMPGPYKALNSKL